MSDFATRQCIRFLWKAIYELNESLHTGPGYDKVKAELIKSADHLKELIDLTERE